MTKHLNLEAIDYIINKFKANPSLKSNLKSKLQQITSQLYLSAQSASTFCYRFQIPHRLPDQLFTTFGVPHDKIKEEFKFLNMHTNRMYEDPYYQALLTLFLVGLYGDDDELRKIAMFLILVKLYNGMQYRYFKHGCKENVAEFVKRTELNGKSLMKNKTPLELIAYFIDTLDNKYASEIKKDPETKILRLFAQTWGRLNQAFKNVAQYYYKHVNDKDIDASIEVMAKDDQGALKINDTLLQGSVDMLTDKFDKAMSIRMPEIPASEKKFLADKLVVTQMAIDKIYNYLKNNPHDAKEQVARFLMSTGISSENDTHKLPIMHTVDKILGRKNETYSTEYKMMIDRALTQIFGQNTMSTISVTQKLKLRKLYSYILFYLFQRVVSKMKQFERTLV